MKFFLLILSICLAHYVHSETAANSNEDLEDARLLVAKNVLNNYVVEGLNLTIKYNIYNIGNSPALNVKLVDENFPSEYFEYATGFNIAQWARIPPQSNVSHIAVVSPKVPGLINITSAVVTYLASERASRVQTGYSTELGEVYIQRLRDYNRKFASHTLDWFLFVVMAAPSILIPYMLWHSSKSKYEKIEKNGKKSN